MVDGRGAPRSRPFFAPEMRSPLRASARPRFLRAFVKESEINFACESHSSVPQLLQRGAEASFQQIACDVAAAHHDLPARGPDTIDGPAPRRKNPAI